MRYDKIVAFFFLESNGMIQCRRAEQTRRLRVRIMIITHGYQETERRTGKKKCIHQYHREEKPRVL